MQTAYLTSMLAACALLGVVLPSCGLGADANLGDDSSALQGGKGARCGDTTCEVDEFCCSAKDSACVQSEDECEVVVPEPPEYDACDGKSCGDTCQPCPPGAVCPPPEGVFSCNQGGECDDAPPQCETPYDPCEGKVCGDACSPCWDITVCDPIAETWCNAEGSCAVEQPVCQGKPCGGELGDTCEASEYCAYVEGQHCGAADATAECMPRPDDCASGPLIFIPVCGCDGNTHGSACAAAMAGTGVLSSGECSP
jgi:hypothetical protein